MHTFRGRAPNSHLLHPCRAGRRCQDPWARCEGLRLSAFLLNDDLKNSAQAQSVESSEANHGLTAFYRKQSAVMQLFGLPRCKRVIPPDDDLQCA